MSSAGRVAHSLRHERVVRERDFDGWYGLIKVVHRVITRRQAKTDGSKPCHREHTQCPAIPTWVQALEEPGSIFLTTHLTTNHFERVLFQARTRSHNKRDSNSRSERKSITSSRFAVDGSLVCLVSHLITCHPVSHITTQSCFLRNFPESSQPVTMSS